MSSVSGQFGSTSRERMKAAPTGGCTPRQGLTRSTSTQPKEGLAMNATRTCSVTGCDAAHEARGLCARHYQQFKVSDSDRPRCSIPECDSAAWSRTWCQAHYQRWQKYGDPLGQPIRQPRPICAADGCARPQSSRGLCKTHASRLRRTGSIADRVPLIERFDEFFQPLADADCWEWTGTRSTEGYGKVGHVYAHRFACERAHGAPASPDLVAMHACDNPPCVNPSHLSWGTSAENSQDMYRKNRHPRARRSA